MRRGISIPAEINKYLNTMPNASNYIVQLVKADIEKLNGFSKDEVIRLIKEHCSNCSGKQTELDGQIEESVNSFLNL